MRPRLFFLLFMFSIVLHSQTLRMGGYVYDTESRAAIPYSTVQLYTAADSTFVTGCITDDKGHFRLSVANMDRKKMYYLRVSYMGYSDSYCRLNVSTAKDSLSLPRIYMEQTDIMLNEAVVVGQAAPVLSVGDTLVYNASAFRVPEGSMLEDLLKQLPGAELGDNGTLTINGKTISKIMLDGDEFFTNDLAMVAKNVPASMIDQLKTYDRQSDQARITGVEDDEEETVLDLKVKKDMSKGYFNNVNLSGGSEELYELNANLNRFKKKDKYTLMGASRNVDGPRSSNNGNSKHGQAGFNFINKKEYLETNGNINYSHSSSSSVTETSSERFLTKKNSFSNSMRENGSSSDNVSGSGKIEWKPDTLWNILLRPSLDYSESDNSNQNRNGTFKVNPYDYSQNPLDDFETEGLFPDSSRVNLSKNRSMGNGERMSGSVQLQVNRRLAKKGRNITLRLNTSFNTNENSSFTRATTNYYLVQNKAGGDSLLYRNRYVPNSGESFEGSAQLSYVEPVFTKCYLQFYYKYSYRYNWSDRRTYDLAQYVDENAPLDFLPDYYGEPVENLTKSARYDNYIHEGQISFRISQKKLKFSVGVRMNNTETRLDYKQRFDTVCSRSIFDVSPNTVFRYRFSKQTNLKIEYWCRTSQPSMTDLLPVTDDSNPMNVWKGNPELKPTFQNQLKAQFDTYNTELQRGMNCYFQTDISENSISDRVEYDEESGGVTRSPANINGNWSMSGNVGLNTSLKDKRFSVSSQSSVNHRNQVGFLRVSSQEDSQKNITRNTSLSQRLSGRFRGDWLEVSLKGNINYNHTRNKLRPQNNLNTYRYSYGAEVFVRLPLNFSVNSDFTENSRRGYDNSEFNTDELLWNVQFAYKFLKEKAATISLNFYDILNNQSNISRQISASSRSDTRYTAIHSYWLMRFSYKLNIFGV